MKIYNNEDKAFDDADLSNKWPLYAAPDNDDEDEDEDEETGDWGDVDPAGGEPPTSPGSAV